MNDIEHALSWIRYSVRRRDKAPLLEFITNALKQRGSMILHQSDPGHAPFYVVFETPGGERHGILCYAFYANKYVNRTARGERPADEHRFQIKYGGDLTATMDVAIDPTGLVTTLFLGISPELGIFVAADPTVNTPAPMSRSIEFKDRHVEAIKADGWAVWERERRIPRSTDRRAFDAAEEDLRTEVLIGGRQDRLLDLILLERVAQGLDPGERHLAAEKLPLEAEAATVAAAPHALLEELAIPDAALFDLIQGASRLKMAVRGWVAEHHLEEQLSSMPQVSNCRRLDEEGRPDIELSWKGRGPILMECKNTLRTTYADGTPKVDFQRTRAAKGDPCSRYYQSSDFPILAACLHPVLDRWKYRFALTATLPPHSSCPGRIQNLLRVDDTVFATAEATLDRHVSELEA